MTKDRNRLALGKELGADYIINVEKDSLDLVKDITDGLGADVAIECAGAGASLDQCIKAVRKGAQLVEVGLFGHDVEVNMDQGVIKELTILPSFAYQHKTWKRAIKLFGEGKLKTAPLVSGSFPLTEWEKAFETVKARQGHKYLLLPVG
jgi:L-iditol 2-dehydrogenase